MASQHNLLGELRPLGETLSQKGYGWILRTDIPGCHQAHTHCIYAHTRTPVHTTKHTCTHMYTETPFTPQIILKARRDAWCFTVNIGWEQFEDHGHGKQDLPWTIVLKVNWGNWEELARTQHAVFLWLVLGQFCCVFKMVLNFLLPLGLLKFYLAFCKKLGWQTDPVGFWSESYIAQSA